MYQTSRPWAIGAAPSPTRAIATLTSTKEKQFLAQLPPLAIAGKFVIIKGYSYFSIENTSTTDPGEITITPA